MPAGRWWAEIDPRPYSPIREPEQHTPPTPLSLGLPSLVTLPAPRVYRHGRTALPGLSPSVAVRRLAIQPQADRPGRLSVRIAPPEGTRGASVNLLERLARDLPLGDGPGESADDERPALPAPEFIPLWKRLSYLLKLRTHFLLAADGPLEWPAPLFDYQIDGVRTLLEREALLLADDMGLGETIQALAALRILVVQRQVESCLLIVPAGLVSQWRQALRQWAPELRVSTVRGPAGERRWQWRAAAHVYLTSYETLQRDFTDNPQSPPRRLVWDLVILDEAHKIKNRLAEISRKVKRLRRRRAWALTGTPLENSLDELASLLEFVTPFDDQAPPQPLFPGRALTERHHTLQLRRRKSDVLPQLPPKLVSPILLPLLGQQRQSYERAERQGMVQLQEQGSGVRIEHVLDLIVRLKQICNLDPASGQSAKLDDLRERLATLRLEGHRALIFSQFTDDRHGVRAIAQQLAEHQPLTYTGDLTPRQRDEVLRRFHDDPTHAVLVLSLRAGGQGLNLQHASYVFHFDRWWNPAVERQAEDRSHRLGQRIPVHVYTYTCENTIEERIDRLLRDKQLLFDQVVDGVSIDLRSALTATELFSLFNLAPPDPTRGAP